MRDLRSELVYAKNEVKIFIEDNYYLVLYYKAEEVERVPLEGVTTVEEMDNKLSYLVSSIGITEL